MEVTQVTASGIRHKINHPYHCLGVSNLKLAMGSLVAQWQSGSKERQRI